MRQHQLGPGLWLPRPTEYQACESHRQDLENGVDNPDIPSHIDKNGHDPGVSFISVGDLAKAFYHMPVHPDDRFLTAFNVPGLYKDRTRHKALVLEIYDL